MPSSLEHYLSGWAILDPSKTPVFGKENIPHWLLRRIPWHIWESMSHAISLYPTWDPNAYGFKNSGH